jgi:NAD(P)-dependent dehydrogenase (short-subunit alcohol dehydrogenase family)
MLLKSRRAQSYLRQAVPPSIPNPRSQQWRQRNAAIMALAKAFAEQGIRDGVQVNSIVPGAVMTGRRRSFLEKWAPAHNMSVEATKQFPEKAEISWYGRPEEIADLFIPFNSCELFLQRFQIVL